MDEIITNAALPGVRFTVWQDTSAEDPRNWIDDSHAQTLTYHAAHGYDTDGADDAATGTMQAFMRVYDETGNADLANRVAERYARTFEPEARVHVSRGRGYSQGEWWETVTVVTDAGYGTPEGHAEEFHQWMRGDVYGVTVERLTVCDHGVEHWDAEDSLGGIYADSASSAVAYFREECAVSA